MKPALDELRARHPWPASLPEVPPDLWGWFRAEHERVLGPRLTAGTKLVVELGSWLGLSTRFLCEHAPVATVVAVDHWHGSPEHHAREDWRRQLPTLYETFLVNCAEYRDRLVPVRRSTLDGIAELAELGLVPDLVYVDAGHATADVLADLRAIRQAWPEATVVGDDWRWDTVRAAVEQFADETGQLARVDDTVWTLEPQDTVGLCALAMRPAYRARARALAQDVAQRLPGTTLLVVTDDAADFDGEPNVRVVERAPTGPMAEDYDRAMRLGGAGAYHDKRFALAAALEQAPTAILLDADSRLTGRPTVPLLPPGLTVADGMRESVLDHLLWAGVRRLPAFVGLARHLGDETLLERAQWCQESLVAVTADGREDEFLRVWGHAGDYLQQRGLFSGEGGVIGIAAALAGWDPDFAALDPFAAVVEHERGGLRGDA